MLVEHPDIRMISVTGSTEVGQSIKGDAAGSTNRLHLELDGKAQVSVFEDADVDLGNYEIFGLASSIFTKDVGLAMCVSQLLELGTVWINDHI